MLPVIQQLLVLQDRDQRIRALTKDLRDLPLLQQRAKSRLEDDEAAVASALAAMREVELKIKSLDLDAQTRRTSIARIKDQQFQTRKNEEFQALAHEVTRYENEVRTLEDSELEFMEQLEGRKPAHAQATAKLAETKKLVAEELAAITERGKNVEAQLAEEVPYGHGPDPWLVTSESAHAVQALPYVRRVPSRRTPQVGR